MVGSHPCRTGDSLMIETMPAADDLAIRYATDDDLPALLAVYSQSYPSADFQADGSVSASGTTNVSSTAMR